MRGKAGQHAEQTTRQTDQQEFIQIQPRNFALRQTQTAQHRARVQMAHHEAPRRHRDGHRRQHRR